jgi:glycosyltransferase involved in cell wall biosynthesis
MKVTIVANGFQEDYIVNLVNSLGDQNIEVDLIGSDIYEEYSINDKVRMLNLRGSHSEEVSRIVKIVRIVSYYLKFCKYIVKSKSRTYHIQWLRFYFFEGVLLTWMLRLAGRKVLYTSHDVLPHSKDGWYYRFIFYLIYKSQNTIIAHTEFIRQRLINEFSINPQKIKVVKHGVYKVNLQNTITLASSRKELEIDSESFVILFFGKITKYKGIPLLLESFGILEKKVNNLKLIIAGKVEAEYTMAFREISEKVTSKNIRIVTKYLSDTEVEQVYKASNLVVLPYLEASQSGVLFISYAYGLPVIAPNFGGFPYDVAVGNTGLLFEKENVANLAETIGEAIRIFGNNPELNRERIQNFANENYSWSVSAKQLKEVYY